MYLDKSAMSAEAREAEFKPIHKNAIASGGFSTDSTTVAGCTTMSNGEINAPTIDITNIFSQTLNF